MNIGGKTPSLGGKIPKIGGETPSLVYCFARCGERPSGGK